MCACRSRLTRCSGVSPGIRGGGFGAAPPAAAPPVLEVACGIVEVKRVASLTLRGPILDAMVRAKRREERGWVRMSGAEGEWMMG